MLKTLPKNIHICELEKKMITKLLNRELEHDGGKFRKFFFNIIGCKNKYNFYYTVVYIVYTILSYSGLLLIASYSLMLLFTLKLKSKIIYETYLIITPPQIIAHNFKYFNYTISCFYFFNSGFVVNQVNCACVVLLSQHDHSNFYCI